MGEEIKRQMKLSNFCKKYDVPRTSIMEIIHKSDFPSYKILGRWYIDEAKYLKWRELNNKK